MESITSKDEQKPFFLAATRDLKVPNLLPGIVLAIATLIKLTFSANDELLMCCITSIKDTNKAGLVIQQLNSLGGKLLQTILRIQDLTVAGSMGSRIQSTVSSSRRPTVSRSSRRSYMPTLSSERTR